MIVLTVGAPNSLEVKEVEIHIDVVLLNQLDRDLLLIVREAAELLVLAADIVQVRLTELRLVFVWVIKGLHFVVRTITVVTVLAVDRPEGSVLLCLKDIVADLGLVAAQGASSVLEVVVVWTLLEVVGVRVDIARDDLKVKEVKQLDALVRTNVPGVEVSNSRLDSMFLL